MSSSYQICLLDTLETTFDSLHKQSSSDSSSLVLSINIGFVKEMSQRFEDIAYSDQNDGSVTQELKEKAKDPRTAYLVLMFVTATVALIMRDYANEWFGDFSSFSGCDNEADCYGTIAVFRISFALFLLFLLILIPLCIRGLSAETKESIFLEHWIAKIIFLGFLCAATFFMKNDTLIVYATFAQILSFFFIILQIVLLIDFAYSWNERWVAYDEKKWYIGILVFAFFLYGGAFVIIGYLFDWYTESGPCELNKLFLSITIVGIVLTTAVSLVVEHGALLPSAVIALYTTVLCWDALTSAPESDCTHSQPSNETLQFVIGLIFTGVSLTFGVLNVAKAHEKFTFKKSDNENETNPSIYFMIVLCLAAAYMAMLLSGWEFENTNSDLDINHSKTSMWIRITSQWVTFILYMWTLIAPRVCPDRDYSYA